MDWSHNCCASLYCWTRKVVFRFPSEPVIEWEGGSLAPRGRLISYLRYLKGVFITLSGLKILN